MRNLYQQQLMEFHMKQCENSHPSQHIYPCQYVSILEVSRNTGFLNLNIIDDIKKISIPNATITVYVTDGINRDIPIMYLITAINPIRIELPMANELGTKILGPEYSFSTYDLRVEAFGYFSNNVYNIRLFPNTTTTYEISLVPTSQNQLPPVKIEQRLDMPPLLRDELN